MRKLKLAIIIILAITVIGMTAGLSYAWFAAAEVADSTVLHQANSPQANVEIQDIYQTGELSPAVPYVSNVGVPSYISDRDGFDTYVAQHSLLETDNIYLIKPIKSHPLFRLLCRLYK